MNLQPSWTTILYVVITYWDERSMMQTEESKQLKLPQKPTHDKDPTDPLHNFLKHTGIYEAMRFSSWICTTIVWHIHNRPAVFRSSLSCDLFNIHGKNQAICYSFCTCWIILQSNENHMHMKLTLTRSELKLRPGYFRICLTVEILSTKLQLSCRKYACTYLCLKAAEQWHAWLWLH